MEGRAFLHRYIAGKEGHIWDVRMAHEPALLYHTARLSDYRSNLCADGGPEMLSPSLSTHEAPGSIFVLHERHLSVSRALVVRPCACSSRLFKPQPARRRRDDVRDGIERVKAHGPMPRERADEKEAQA